MSLAVVLAGGTLVPDARVLELAERASLVIAADGGAAHWRAVGRRPDLWVGDFDSTPPELERELAGVPQEAHPTDKARVDGEIALEAARAWGATTALVLGGLGGRADHALALALTAARLSAAGFPVDLDSGEESAHPLAPARPLELRLPAGRTFSVLALSPVARALSVSGARWPLDRADLPFGSGWGVSNVATGPLRASLEDGLALVVVQHRAV